MTDLSVRIGTMVCKNPVWSASGTFGCGRELEKFFDVERIGALVLKTVTVEPREGNPPPRVIETSSGLLNSIGLENKGAKWLVEKEYPLLKKRKTRTIISFAAFSENEWKRCAEILTQGTFPDAFELNLSCPNVTHSGRKGMLVSQDARAVQKAVRAVKKVTKKPIIAKLTPNITEIAGIAIAAQTAGADAVAVANTFQGIAVDPDNMKPYFKRVVGGLSGPAIKPLALKAVRDAYLAVRIPVIGVGGIMSGRDVAEFMLCGASAVQVGTATLRDPQACDKILKEFREYLEKVKIKKARDIVGKIG